MTMLRFREQDFLPLAEFGRRWRFTDPRYNALPATALARIRPLKPSIAHELLAAAAEMCREPVHGALDIDARLDEVDEDVVQRELAKLPVSLDSEIIALWDADDALVTDWAVFVQYWSDFCYASSDDVTVWPTTGTWALCYHHDELFSFVSQRVAG